VDNIKLDLREIRWTGSIWLRIELWRALVNTVMNLRVPSNVRKLIQLAASQEGLSSMKLVLINCKEEPG
jgi:hypothetical protein